MTYKYEQVTNIKKIKEMAIAGWPINYEGYPIKYSNQQHFVCGDKLLNWDLIISRDFEILNPALNFDEAKKLLNKKVIWAINNGRLGRILKLSNTEGEVLNLHTNTIFFIRTNGLEVYYPFCPEHFQDLLEPVKKSIKPHASISIDELSKKVENLSKEIEELKNLAFAVK